MTRNPHSVWVRSRTSSSPRCVGLAPTTTAPVRAAASSQKTNSGTLSNRTATWKGPGAGAAAQPGAPCRRRRDHLGVAQRDVARPQAEPGVVGAGQHGAGDGLGRTVARGSAGAQVGSLHLQKSLTWEGTPIIGTRCILALSVLPSQERRRNGPRPKRRTGTPHGIRDLQRRVRAAEIRRAAWRLGRARPHHGRGRVHRGGGQGRLQVHLGLRAPLPYHLLAPLGLRVLPRLLRRQDQQHPHRLGHLQHHAPGEPPGPHCRAGGHVGPPERGPLRVRHRPRQLDDRAARLRHQ